MNMEICDDELPCSCHPRLYHGPKPFDSLERYTRQILDLLEISMMKSAQITPSHVTHVAKENA